MSKSNIKFDIVLSSVVVVGVVDVVVVVVGVGGVETLLEHVSNLIFDFDI